MEDAPCPSFFGAGETPKPGYEKEVDIKDKIISEVKSVEVDFNNKKYIFQLGKSENNKNIIFKIIQKKLHNFSYFIAYINLNQFNNINSIFSFYSTIDEIYSLLLKNMEEKKFSLSISDDKYVITFEFLMPGNKIVKVDFYLKEEKTNNTMILNDIYSIIDNLEEENNSFKEEIKNLKNEDKKLKEDLDIKNKEIINLKNEINGIKDENKLIKEKIKSLVENIIKMNIKYNKGNLIIEEDIKENYEKNKDLMNIKEKEENKNEIKNDDESETDHNCIQRNLDNNQINIQDNIILEEEQLKENNKIIKEQKDRPHSDTNKDDINSNKPKNQKTKSLPLKEKNEEIIENIQDINVSDLFTESKIICKEKYKKYLYNWLTMKGGHILEIKLIFQSSVDGDDYDIFFEKCRGEGPFLSVIKSNKKIFGGFSKGKLTDEKETIKIKDEKAFVYSLNKLKKYDVLKSDIAVSFYHKDFLLMYGNNNDRYGLRIHNNFLNEKNYENFDNKSYDTPEKYCFTGKNDFSIEELEIYLIIFEK